MDREERELIQNLIDRLDGKLDAETTKPAFTGNPGQVKQERPNIYNVSRSSAMIPDSHFFRKLMGIDL